jgi:hypothetical protein
LEPEPGICSREFEIYLVMVGLCGLLTADGILRGTLKIHLLAYLGILIGLTLFAYFKNRSSNRILTQTIDSTQILKVKGPVQLRAYPIFLAVSAACALFASRAIMNNQNTAVGPVPVSSWIAVYDGIRRLHIFVPESQLYDGNLDVYWGIAFAIWGSVSSVLALYLLLFRRRKITSSPAEITN